MPNKSKSVRCQYDDKDMERAVTAVSCGMSIRTAAAQFGVPQSTLHDRVSGKVGPSPSQCKQTVFPENVESLQRKSKRRQQWALASIANSYRLRLLRLQKNFLKK